MIGQYEKESDLTVKTKMCFKRDCHVLRKLWIRIYNIFYELHEKQSDLKAFLKIVWTWSIRHCGDKSTVAQSLDMLVFATIISFAKNCGGPIFIVNDT